MLIYLFKGSRGEHGDIQEVNEVTAHNLLRNVNTWQRQDLKYLGAVDDKELREFSSTLKEKAINQVLDEIPKLNTMKKEIELAKLELDDCKDATLIPELQSNFRRVSLKYDVERAKYDEMLRSTSEFISLEVDNLQAKCLKLQSELYQEKLRSLVPDPNIQPRNFNSVTSGFSGDDVIPQKEIGLQ